VYKRQILDRPPATVGQKIGRGDAIDALLIENPSAEVRKRGRFEQHPVQLLCIRRRGQRQPWWNCFTEFPS